MRDYFSIVSMGRSGSTYLQRLLDSHPSITCKGEVISRHSPYGKVTGVSIRSYIENTVFGARQGVVGFKMPWDHIIDYPDVFGAFRDLNFRLIFLKRINKLDLFISMKLAQQTGVWNSDRTYPDQKVDVSFDELYQFIVSSLYTDAILERMCSAFPYMGVIYEELVVGKHYAEVQDFLGVPYHPLHPQTVRSRTLPRRSVLANFDELAAQFSETEFAGFFSAEEFLGV